MYRNYDGARSTFGDTSILVRSSNPDIVSAFGAIRSADSALTLMLINKSTSAAQITMTVAHFVLPESLQRWQLTDTNIIERVEDLPGRGADGESALSVSLPPQSITLLVAPPTGERPGRRRIAHH
jgi:hypothetical protein